MRIENAKKLLFESFENSRYMQENRSRKEYRYYHSLRVAKIGQEIAEQEGFNVDALTIACLLHDISYTQDLKTREDRINHGRKSAEMVESFINSLDFDAKTKMDILHGIASHVDDKSKYNWKDSKFSKSVSDADNIDRFGLYRIYETLQFAKFSNMDHADKLQYCLNQIEIMSKLLDKELSTKTATKMFNVQLKRIINTFNDLYDQLNASI